MTKTTSVLLVHDYEYPLADLTLTLKRLGLSSRRARTCIEAKSVLASPEPPTLVFTDTELPDGGWPETVGMASRSRPPIPVIVVSRVVDISLYLDAMQDGAAEFIVPPFREADIRYVVQGARMDSGGKTYGRVRAVASAAAAAPDLPVLRSKWDHRGQAAPKFTL